MSETSNTRITYTKEPDGRWSCTVGEKQLHRAPVLATAVYQSLEEMNALDLLNASTLIAEKLESAASANQIETTVEELEALARQ